MIHFGTFNFSTTTVVHDILECSRGTSSQYSSTCEFLFFSFFFLRINLKTENVQMFNRIII